MKLHITVNDGNSMKLNEAIKYLMKLVTKVGSSAHKVLKIKVY